jgi:hypothetical protein
MYFNLLSPGTSHLPVWKVEIPKIKEFDESLLEDDKWIVDDYGKTGVDIPEQHRFWYEHSIKEIFEIFSEENILFHLDKLFKDINNRDMLNTLYQYNRHNQYAKPSEWLQGKLDIECNIAKDIKGMKINGHVDTRIYFGTFICNLIDNTTSTVFEASDVDSSATKGEGVFWLNDTTTKHSIEHLEDNDRLIVYVQLRFKVLD